MQNWLRTQFAVHLTGVRMLIACRDQETDHSFLMYTDSTIKPNFKTKGQRRNENDLCEHERDQTVGGH